MKEETTDANASLNQSTPIGWYKWYPRDFLASSTVRRMSITAQGIYRALLDLQWEDGFVPVDYHEACFIIRANETEAEAFRPFFDKCFPNGLNRRMAEIRQQAIDDREQQIRAGKKSAEARMKSGKSDNHGSTTVQQRFNSGSTTVQPEVNSGSNLGSNSNTRSTDVQRPFNDRSTTVPTKIQHPFNETETETETETIKIKKRANASSSKKELDYLALAHEAGFEDDMFLKVWSEFVAYRKEIKHPMTKRAAELILGKLKKHSIEVGVEAMNRAISSGWRDCFPEKIQRDTNIKKNGEKGSTFVYANGFIGNTPEARARLHEAKMKMLQEMSGKPAILELPAVKGNEVEE